MKTIEMLNNMRVIKSKGGLIHSFYLVISSCFDVFNILKSAEKVILTILFLDIACENT